MNSGKTLGFHGCLDRHKTTIFSRLRDAPNAPAQEIAQVELLAAFQAALKGCDAELNYVDFAVKQYHGNLTRKIVVHRAGAVLRESEFAAISRP